MEFKIENGVLTDYSGEAAQKDIVIPEGVTEIKNDMFNFWASRHEFKVPESLTLPNSIRHIGKNCFHVPPDYDEPYYSTYSNYPLILFDVKIRLWEICNHYEEPFTDFASSMAEDRDADFNHWIHDKKEENKIVEGVICELNQILERNFASPDIRYLNDCKAEIIAGMFRAYPDDDEICRYIVQNLTYMLPVLLRKEKHETVRKMMDSGKIFSDENIDEIIQYMIEHKEYELQIMLTEYKNNHIGYEDTETMLRKKFKL